MKHKIYNCDLDELYKYREKVKFASIYIFSMFILLYSLSVGIFFFDKELRYLIASIMATVIIFCINLFLFHVLLTIDICIRFEKKEDKYSKDVIE